MPPVRQVPLGSAGAPPIGDASLDLGRNLVADENRTTQLRKPGTM